eukprot:6228387-Amphidinium_carterae.2
MLRSHVASSHFRTCLQRHRWMHLSRMLLNLAEEHSELAKKERESKFIETDTHADTSMLRVLDEITPEDDKGSRYKPFHVSNVPAVVSNEIESRGRLPTSEQVDLGAPGNP